MQEKCKTTATKTCKKCTIDVQDRCKASKHAYMDETCTKSGQEMCNKIATIVKKRTKSVQEQMDMQYKDLLNGTTTWKDAVAKVKSDNPKE